MTVRRKVHSPDWFECFVQPSTHHSLICTVLSYFAANVKMGNFQMFTQMSNDVIFLEKANRITQKKCWHCTFVQTRDNVETTFETTNISIFYLML